MSDRSCNGGRNYETWLVNVWPTNGAGAGALFDAARSQPVDWVEVIEAV